MTDRELLSEEIADSELEARTRSAERQKARAIVSFVLLGIVIVVTVFLAVMVCSLFSEIRASEELTTGLEPIGAVLGVFLILVLSVIGAMLSSALSFFGFLFALSARRVEPSGLRVAVIVTAVIHALTFTAPFLYLVLLLVIFSY